MYNRLAPITVLLVDDEKDSRQVLAHYLQGYPHLEIIAEAVDSEQAYEKIISLKPHLVFLDIQMPLGDGFSLLRRFEKIDFEVVFVTSYDQYAISAFKVNALDYLLKPVTAADVEFAVNKATTHLAGKRNRDLQIKKLLAGTDADKTKKFAVHVSGKVKMVDARDILYIHASGRYSVLTLFDGLSYTLVKSLKEVETDLYIIGSFIRISKSQLVNTLGIKEYSKGLSCFITMADLKIFEVSRRKKTAVLAMLSKREKG